MEKSLKEKIISYINKHDPKNEIVEIDEVNRTISYNNQISSPPVKFENEGYIRAFLVVKLVKELDYPIDCIELEKHYNIGSRPEDKSAFLDILVRDKRNKNETFLAIECKTPEEFEKKKKNIETQLFNIAAIQSQDGKVKYLIYYSLSEFELDERMVVIDYERNNSYTKWSSKKDEEELNVIPPDYGISYHAHYAKVSLEEAKSTGLKRLSNELKREEFWKLKDKLHNVLWGGGSSNYNDVFYYLMHLFLAKIYDELWRKDGEVYEFQIHYEDGIRESHQKTFERVENLYRKAQSNLLNQPKEIIEKSTFIDLDKLAIEKVISAIKMLQGISLTENKNESDILGDFFEAIVSTEFKQDKGQFFTHRNIVQFIIEVLDIKEEVIKRLNAEDEADGLLPYIIDPSCGSGTFLLESIKAISKYYLENKARISVSKPIKDIIQHRLFIEDPDDKNKVNAWAYQYIYGIEPNVELATATKVNMILHGDGNANIYIKDGLAGFDEYQQAARITAQQSNKLQLFTNRRIRDLDYSLNEQFDFVITNPPFSLSLGDDEGEGIYKNRFIYANKKNSENLFIERWYQLLKEGGKIGAVLPDSIFDTTENKYIRLFLYKYFKVNSVVSLDKIAFQPYTSTKVSILFATKKTKSEVEQFEEKWEFYSKEYLKLRNSDIIKIVLKNESLMSGKNGLIKLCDRYNIDFKPTSKLINSISFTEQLKEKLLNVILPLEIIEAYEESERLMNDLETIRDVSEYIKINGIKNKERDKNQKDLFAQLKRSVKVQDYIVAKKAHDELSKKVKENRDYEILMNIDSFVMSNNIANVNENQELDILRKLLKEYYPEGLQDLVEVVERAYDVIQEVCEQDYPDWFTTKAQAHQQLFVNSWWVFGEVSKVIDNNIFYAEVEGLGYKRTKRGEQKRVNELFAQDEDNNIVINKITPVTVLDFIKSEGIW